MKIPAAIEPKDVTAIIDTREQRPLELAPLGVTVGTLDTGDYSLVGCEHVVRIERKSLDDLLGCVGRDRERFDREVQRLLAYPVRVLIVEATWQTMELGQWRSKVTPAAAIGSLLGWQAMGLSIHMVGDHQRAGRHVSRLLFTVAKRRYRELRTLIESTKGD
jgi:ERCC4-type nuclease